MIVMTRAINAKYNESDILGELSKLIITQLKRRKFRLSLDPRSLLLLYFILLQASNYFVYT